MIANGRARERYRLRLRTCSLWFPENRDPELCSITASVFTTVPWRKSTERKSLRGTDTGQDCNEISVTLAVHRAAKEANDRCEPDERRRSRLINRVGSTRHRRAETLGHTRIALASSIPSQRPFRGALAVYEKAHEYRVKFGIAEPTDLPSGGVYVRLSLQPACIRQAWVELDASSIIRVQDRLVAWVASQDDVGVGAGFDRIVTPLSETKEECEPTILRRR